MAWKDLEKEFKAAVTPGSLTSHFEGEPDSIFRYWQLRLLFEIAGNLDSLVVSYRELVKLHKDKAAK